MLQKFTQEVKNTIAESLNNIHISLLGTIKKINDDGTIDVLPQTAFTKPDGELMNYPQICGVNIFGNGGGAEAGQKVLLIFLGHGQDLNDCIALI